MSKLDLNFFFLPPVEVVKVHPKNLHEVAEWCGGTVREMESRREPGRMSSYVHVPMPKNTAIDKAFPGMYVVKRITVNEKSDLRTSFLVFRKNYFLENYFESPLHALDATWERQSSEAKAAKILEMNEERKSTYNIHIHNPNPGDMDQVLSMVEQRQLITEDETEAAG